MRPSTYVDRITSSVASKMASSTIESRSLVPDITPVWKPRKCSTQPSHCHVEVAEPSSTQAPLDIQRCLCTACAKHEAGTPGTQGLEDREHSAGLTFQRILRYYHDSEKCPKDEMFCRRSPMSLCTSKTSNVTGSIQQYTNHGGYHCLTS